MKNTKEIITGSNYLFPLLVLLSSFISIKLIFSQKLSFEIHETGYALSSNIDVDSSGQFIAVWQDYRHCSEYDEGGEVGSTAIYVQMFDTNGGNMKCGQ